MDLLANLAEDGHINVHTAITLFACARFVADADEQSQAAFMKRFGTCSMETLRKLLQE